MQAHCEVSTWSAAAAAAAAAYSSVGDHGSLRGLHLHLHLHLSNEHEQVRDACHVRVDMHSFVKGNAADDNEQHEPTPKTL